MSGTDVGNLRLFGREPKIKVLHLSWVAFFISFFVWFNHAPLMAAIRETFALSKEQELCRKVGDSGIQAADLISAAISIPSLNLTPLMTLGN